jgi:hypothetical protein
MTTKAVKGIRVVAGKVKQKSGFHAKRKAHKWDREAKAWAAKSAKTQVG